MTITAPLALYTTTVLPAWIDYNNHMMDGYYGVPFSFATDAFLDYVGLDAAYRARSGCSTYTAEGHTLFLRELKLGATLALTTQLLGYDAKRMHLFHALHHADAGYLAATCEWLMIHVNQATGRGAPIPEAVLERLAQVYTAHQALPLPPQAGRSIGLQARRAIA
jgi:acyl-CoA thioester hydrolase